MSRKSTADEIAQIREIVQRIGPLLAGKPPAVQSGALADCVAMYLAGHVVLGDAEATRELREEVYEVFMELVWALVELNARQIGTWIDEP
jgi:hypothetical protein